MTKQEFEEVMKEVGCVKQTITVKNTKTSLPAFQYKGYIGVLRSTGYVALYESLENIFKADIAYSTDDLNQLKLKLFYS